jgi:acetyl-CoA decarbonylase/synthase complex subunit beta
MPSNIKDRVKDYIPADVVDKIATENDVETLDQLKEFLEHQNHPVLERWQVEEELAIPLSEEGAPMTTQQMTSIPISGIPMAAGGFTIILKDAKIVAKKMIIRAEKKGA